MRLYSPFFETLHDERHPVGYIGPGVHYSVFRAMVFHDESGQSLKEARYHDFAVIWDEDHDDRVVEAIEKTYAKGLLPYFIFFGENRARLTALSKSELQDEKSVADEIKLLCDDIVGDRWKSDIGTLAKPHNIIDDDPEKVKLYLENIQMLWWLGSKPFEYD